MGNESGYTGLIAMVLTIVIIFALLYIGSYVNGTLSSELEDSYGTATGRTPLQNQTVSTSGNLSDNYDTSLDIIQVTVIITVLAGAIGAIFLFTKFR